MKAAVFASIALALGVAQGAVAQQNPLTAIDIALEPDATMLQRAKDANARGIHDGDNVRVFNHRGDILLKARVDGVVQPGVVSAKLHWAKFTQGNRNINVLTSEKLTDLGNSATFYSVLVEVELAKAEFVKRL